MEKVQKFNAKVRARATRPNLEAGDIVKVHRKIKEGGKERVQIFEGIVVSVKGKQSSSPTATIRRVSFGTGVEITVPIFSPTISKVEITKKAKVRRSKLYYLRRKGIRLSKLKTKELDKFVAEEEIEEPEVLDEKKENEPVTKESKEPAKEEPDEKK